MKILYVYENVAWEYYMKMSLENVAWKYCIRMLDETVQLECWIRKIDEHYGWEWWMIMMNDNVEWECWMRFHYFKSLEILQYFSTMANYWTGPRDADAD